MKMMNYTLVFQHLFMLCIMLYLRQIEMVDAWGWLNGWLNTSRPGNCVSVFTIPMGPTLWQLSGKPSRQAFGSGSLATGN